MVAPPAPPQEGGEDAQDGTVPLGGVAPLTPPWAVVPGMQTLISSLQRHREGRAAQDVAWSCPPSSPFLSAHPGHGGALLHQGPGSSEPVLLRQVVCSEPGLRFPRLPRTASRVSLARKLRT